MGQRGLEFLLRQAQLDRLVDIWNTMLELHKALNRLPVQNSIGNNRQLFFILF